MIANRKKVHILLGLLIIALFLFPIIHRNEKKPFSEIESEKDIHPSLEVPHTTQWIKNPTMEAPIEPTWFWENGTEGDNSDVEATSSPGQADFRILGEEKTFADLYGTPNSSTSLGWREFNNDGFLLPDSSGINSEGCYATHTWSEGPNQFPSVHWRTNVSLSDDMSDYTINSVSLSAIFNASVNANVDAANDSTSVQYYAIGDFVRFYIQIADIEYKNSYTVALNKTRYLGQNTGTSILTIADTLIESYNESVLITALNAAFEKDLDHSNFTITLGIDIYSEDNWQGGDTDTFTLLMIKSCNLTITYIKKIDQSTTISWNQIGNQLSGANIQITGASFNFEYKVDTLWPIAAPLSEIRFLINNKIYTKETIKLSSATTIFQEAKVGGYDVSGLVDKDVNISVSIEVFIKDRFDLDEIITISIDNVFLNISYIETLPDKETNLQLFLNTENKTLDPVIEVIKDTLLNITVKFTNETGDHISGAIIEVRGDKLLNNLTENILLEQYSRTINVTDDLLMGVNVLTIEATYPDHETIVVNPRITVRRIQTEISTIAGTNSININSGDDAFLEIVLNDTDYGGTIKGAIVTYTWEGGDDFLTDLDNDGIYTGVLSNVPSGTYTIIIFAFAGDDYDFENFEITLNAISLPGSDWSWLVYILIGAIVGLGTIIGLYQTHFKYPPMVRKIRKLRKKIGKDRKKIKPIDINKRENIVNNTLQDKIEVFDVQFDTTPSKKTQKIEKNHNLGDGK